MGFNLDKINYNSAGLADMVLHLKSFDKYLLDAIRIADNFALPSYLINCNRIVFSGMGASGIAGKIINDLATDSKKTIETVSSYKVPASVDKNTLIIALSHSGDTGETLATFVDGFQHGAKLLAVTTGGKLGSLCRKYSAPYIEYQMNSEPKLAIAYLLMIPLILLSKLGVCEFDLNKFSDTLILLQKQNEKINPDIHSATNPAKDLALKMSSNFIEIIGSDDIKSLAERFSQSINEDAKQFAAFSVIPEMNHNLIAGIEFPKNKLKDLFFVLLESKFSIPEIKKRENITAALLSKKKLAHSRIFFQESFDRLTEIILMINFCSFASFYLSIENNANPISAEAVKFIKNEIRKE